MKLIRLSLLAMVAAIACTAPAKDPTEPGGDPPPVPPRATSEDNAFATAASTGRFLTQATFGPRPNEVARLRGTSASAWFEDQLARSASQLLPQVQQARETVDAQDLHDTADFLVLESPTFAFWQNSLAGEDQLRQRMAWALSQIFVISDRTELLSDIPEALAYFEDLLITGAFGTFRELLERVTYSPAMAYYLTYLGSEKANPVTGAMPDENYAREIMQLFSIGVVELDIDGQPTTREGRAETYTNADITGLAKVFTGMRIEYDEVSQGPGDIEPNFWTRPLVFNAQLHSTAEKRFLGATIAANTSGPDSIRQALDTIANHPNVAPFIGRQLIQRFVTSAPSPAYVARVAQTFEAGTYRLPNGNAVGTGSRGDLAATLAAVLFDDRARLSEPGAESTFGKVREPILRLSAWVRAFEVQTIDPVYWERLWDTSAAQALMQHPYRAPSVFNFYRPGYVAPGTESGAAGLTSPELQLLNASSLPGYANFLFEAIAREPEEEVLEGIQEWGGDFERARRAFAPNYSTLTALAQDPTALVNDLNARLTYGTLSSETRASIERVVSTMPEDMLFRVHIAIWMLMTSPDFMVQR